ncbi:DUF1826 domain-containing protein [Marinivivus vitaminiproducens]|uniref:DUF1826 domain-containing protein n=1 Tax=Marinivivus vitaminiproducens TaxID=3035935 RepID=UPI0027A00595|nr:DUF1826 domain-containing protein [Geminicoccaceae bacterium SCSIO 64248]
MVLETHDPEDLARIHDDDVQLVVWRRTLPSAFNQWLADLPPDRLPDGRVLVDLGHVCPAVASLIDQARMPAGAMRDTLFLDIVDLAERFARITGMGRIDIRLQAIGGRACWRFHRDRVVARMLTTYRGMGTDWIAPSDSQRALDEQAAFAGPIHRMPEHAVSVFKGDVTDSGQGIVHRSPPVSGDTECRLLLCLNLPFQASPSLWSPEETT